MEYRFKKKEIAVAKSGKTYVILRPRPWDTDEPKYDVKGWRGGKPYGPIRTMKETSLART